MAVSSAATSATVLPIGPGVSWLWAMGTMCVRESSPSMGLNETMPLSEPGQTREPSVSVPSAAAARLAATAAPLPELDPQALRSSTYGFFTRPPMADQPLIECELRMFAHSLKLALPRMTAPAARNRATTGASRRVMLCASASEPAVVATGSAVSMLSFTRMGMPCRGPRAPLAPRSASSARASASALGFSDSTLRSAGPSRSIFRMRAR